MLAQAEKLAAAGQLAAGIAHEIRNPLAAVKTIVFALQSELAPGDARRADFEIMGEEIEQMERAIQRFLDFARPQEPVFALVSMRQALANAAALLSRQAQEQGVELAVRAETDLVVRADRRQLEQVFVNLMLNALQVMPDGGRLSAVLRQDHRPAGGGERGEWVEAEIADTGPGIPEPLLARIFDPFVTGRAGGVGLGLAIVRQIVGQHQGRISVRNQPAGGAAFTLRLPAMEGQAE
jgi:signal transduction histidine kinase